MADVNQTTPTGAQATGSVTGTTVTTSALAALADDMVLIAGTAVNNGIYTINYAFTRGIAETSASSCAKTIHACHPSMPPFWFLCSIPFPNWKRFLLFLVAQITILAYI